MAAIGFFPFVFDTSMNTCSQPKTFLYPRQPGKCRVLACLGDLTVGCCSSRAGRISLNCGRLVTRFGGVQAGQIFRSKAQGTDSSDVDDDSEYEDTLQAAIEKSKKVLDMQKGLLQQIAERRKLVTSIRSSVVDPDNEEVSYKGSHGSSSTLDSPSADGNVAVEDYKDGSISSSGGLFPVNDDQEVLRSVVSKHFGESSDDAEKDLALRKASISEDSHLLGNSTASTASDGLNESEKDLNAKIASVDTNDKKYMKQGAEKVKPNVPSSFFSSSSTVSSIKNEKDVYFEKSKLEDIKSEISVPTNEDVKPPPLAGHNVMNVILVAAECAPWSKTGGLGDVAGALPKALARRGHRVMVVAPRYSNYDEPHATGVMKSYRVDGQDMEVNYFHAYMDGVDFVFIESPMFWNLENKIYGGNRVDILKRMILFCKAAIEVPWHVPCGGVCYGDGNLVFIANDWHTALLPVYLKAYYRDNGLMKYTRSVLVIHNMAHQGRGPVDDFSFVDLPPHYVDLFKLYDPIGGEHFNIFAAGLKTADRIVTVSRGYAWELKTSEGGWGLHEIINENDWKLKGIVNGIDMKEWNPELDVHLQLDGYTNYSLESLQTGKPKCKAALQKELGLPVRDDAPLIGFIGRLDHQKGVDLIAEAIPWMMGQDVQLVMLGTGRDDLEQMLRQFESQHREKVRGWVGFSVKTAHRITAGCDILLMPSRFEPCGLNQLYAMCYGTVPVVHAVGGLKDTVQPFDPYGNSGFGWTFAGAEANQLINALGNCLLTYRQYKESWEGLQRRGMKQDLSWDNAAQIYEEVLVTAKYQW